MKRLLSFLAVSAALLSSSLHAAETLATFEFSGQPGDQDATPSRSAAEHLTVSELRRGPGLDPLAVAESMASTKWTQAEALDPSSDDFLEFTVTPAKGHVVSVTDLEFYVTRSSSGPKSFSIRTSLDDFASDAANVHEYVEPGARKLEFSFSPELEKISKPITIRIYGWSASSNSGGSAHLSVTLTVKGFMGLP